MPVRERGQRRPRDHVHLMAGALPFARQVGGVDALAAAVHVAAIGEQGDPHGRGAQAGRSELACASVSAGAGSFASKESTWIVAIV